MKLAFISFVLFAAAVSAQTSSMKACVAAVKADIGLVQQLVADYKAGSKLHCLEDVLKGVELLEKTSADCKGINRKDVLKYFYATLTTEQKTCITQVYATILVSIDLAANLKGKDWSLASADTQKLLSSLNVVINVCTPVTLAMLAK